MFNKFLILDNSSEKQDEEKHEEQKEWFIYGPNCSLAKESTDELCMNLEKSITNEENSKYFKNFIIQSIERITFTMHQPKDSKMRS